MKKIFSLEEFEQETLVLERIYMELEGRRNIISFMVTQNLTENINYKKYWEEYLEFLYTYKTISDNYVKNCINKILGYELKGKWEVDFTNREVIIYEN